MPDRRPLACLALVALLALAGCETSGPSAGGGKNPRLGNATSVAQLRPGDTLMVSLLGIPDPSSTNAQIDEQGIISLPYIGNLQAGGLNTAELSRSIRDTYIAKQFYTTLDVSVTVTERYIYIGGEVQRPGRIPWSPDMTLAKAIQAAGGFTLYAKESRVTLTRDRAAHDFDVRLAQRNPDEDPLLFPGDSIQVPRSAF
jgi:protein involved in polysaccharide export with SLBB domain